jgi:hypothetical protein
MPAMLSSTLLGLQQLVALLVDHLALVVVDVVEVEQVLADVEVVRLDLALRLLDLAADHAVLDASSSFMPMRAIAFCTQSAAKIRIRLSSSDR